MSDIALYVVRVLRIHVGYAMADITTELNLAARNDGIRYDMFNYKICGAWEC
jgi:hypothetical protein